MANRTWQKWWDITSKIMLLKHCSFHLGLVLSLQCPPPQFLSFPPFLLADLLPPSLLLSLFTVGAVSCHLMRRGPYSEEQKACHQSLEWPLKQILICQSLKMTAAQLLTMTVSWLQTRARTPQVSCSRFLTRVKITNVCFLFKLLSLGIIYHAAINN